ncbi:hypothetical protein AB8Q19_00020 [Candidatus Profftella armatura]
MVKAEDQFPLQMRKVILIYIKDCYQKVNIDPRDINYIEAQGMGNVLSDLTEWKSFNYALKSIAKQNKITLENKTCYISTIKPMTGHMESASGLGALFKVIRSMHTKLIHKVIGFKNYHPDMDREKSTLCNS